MTSSHLLRSSDLAVRYIRQHTRKPLIVTFSARRPRQSLDAPGFGMDFLQKYGYSAAHVTVSANHWYQTHEMEAALSRIAEVARDHSSVITYGSSMGGHAALLFANRLNASAVALSPLFSIDPAVVPFDRRYRPDAENIAEFIYRPEMMEGVKGFAVYDPLSLDRRHMALIAQTAELTLVPLPLSGHPSTTYLAEVGAISALVRQMFVGGELRAHVWARSRRRSSARYWRCLSTVARIHRRPALAVQAGERAVAIAPDDKSCAKALALANNRLRRGSA